MVIAARDVPRWVQPTPTTTAGDAPIYLTGDPQAQAVIAGWASATVAATAAARIITTGTAAILYNDDLKLFPQVSASAEVVFDNTAEVEDHLGVAVAPAVADIAAPAGVVTLHDGPVTLLIIARVDAAPQLAGDAEVTMADYGQGSKPILPFKFPVLFTDNLLDVQDAAAEVYVTGDGYDIQGGTSGDAIVRVTGVGLFEQQGNTPIFPFAFPIVFSDAANIQRGLASVSITGPGELIADVAADAQAAITAEGIQANPAVFPMTLPVVLA